VNAASRVAWAAGWPVRAVLVLLIRTYRLTLGQVIGGNCRFYPSCSAYAERAVRELGAVRGSALSVWRVLRCSPLTSGGVDHPPMGRHRQGGNRELYDVDIHSQHVSPSSWESREAGS
jgi:uncharacterized protein